MPHEGHFLLESLLYQRNEPAEKKQQLRFRFTRTTTCKLGQLSTRALRVICPCCLRPRLWVKVAESLQGLMIPVAAELLLPTCPPLALTPKTHLYHLEGVIKRLLMACKDMVLEQTTNKAFTHLRRRYTQVSTSLHHCDYNHHPQSREQLYQ